MFQVKSRIRSWAEKILKNITRGYTAAYATDGASDWAMPLANARAGGSVMLPESRPQISKKFLLRTILVKNPTIIKGRAVIAAP